MVNVKLLGLGVALAAGVAALAASLVARGAGSGEVAEDGTPVIGLRATGTISTGDGVEGVPTEIVHCQGDCPQLGGGDITLAGIKLEDGRITIAELNMGIQAIIGPDGNLESCGHTPEGTLDAAGTMAAVAKLGSGENDGAVTLDDNTVMLLDSLTVSEDPASEALTVLGVALPTPEECAAVAPEEDNGETKENNGIMPGDDIPEGDRRLGGWNSFHLPHADAWRATRETYAKYGFHAFKSCEFDYAANGQMFKGKYDDGGKGRVLIGYPYVIGQIKGTDSMMDVVEFIWNWGDDNTSFKTVKRSVWLDGQYKYQSSANNVSFYHPEYKKSYHHPSYNHAKHLQACLNAGVDFIGNYGIGVDNYVGHSLGGAAMTIFNQIYANVPSHVVSFGAPKTTRSGLICKHRGTRYAHHRDPIASSIVGLLKNYTHDVGNDVHQCTEKCVSSTETYVTPSSAKTFMRTGSSLDRRSIFIACMNVSYQLHARYCTWTPSSCSNWYECAMNIDTHSSYHKFPYGPGPGNKNKTFYKKYYSWTTY